MRLDVLPPSPESQVLNQIIVELVRRDVVSVDVLHAVAEHFEAEATEGEREANEECAHLARCLIVGADAEPSPARQKRMKRERIRLVQANRAALPDGGIATK